MATEGSSSSSQTPPSPQQKQKAAHAAKLKDNEALFKVVGKSDGRRPQVLFERKMHVKDEKVSAENLLSEQADDIVKFATMKFGGKDIPYIYEVLGVVAGHSDNGKNNNIHYDIPQWLLDILKASANERGGFEMGVEDEHGNVRMIERGNLQQLRALGGKTLVLFYSEAHQYDGTKKEAERAHKGTFRLDDVISNTILFTLQPDPLIQPLRHQSIASPLGLFSYQFKGSSFAQKFVFFDGLSPDMMRLSQELGKNNYLKKLQPVITFQPASPFSPLPPHSLYPSIQGISPPVGEIVVFGGSHFSKAAANQIQAAGSLLENSKRQAKENQMRANELLAQNSIQTSLGQKTATGQSHLVMLAQTSTRLDANATAMPHAIAHSNTSAAKTISSVPVSNPKTQSVSRIPTSISESVLPQTSPQIQNSTCNQISNPNSVCKQASTQASDILHDKQTVSASIALHAPQSTQASATPSRQSVASATLSKPPVASATLLVSRMQTASVIVAQAQALSVKVSKHVKNNCAQTPIIAKAIPLPTKPSQTILIVNKAALLSNKIKAKLIANKITENKKSAKERNAKKAA